MLPSGLKPALDEYSYGTKFKSISFNESGTYAITTSDMGQDIVAVFQTRWSPPFVVSRTRQNL